MNTAPLDLDTTATDAELLARLRAALDALRVNTLRGLDASVAALELLNDPGAHDDDRTARNGRRA